MSVTRVAPRVFLNSETIMNLKLQAALENFLFELNLSTPAERTEAFDKIADGLCWECGEKQHGSVDECKRLNED